jgi:hypothetical protein
MTLTLPNVVIEGHNIYSELVETPLPTNDFLNWPVADGAPWVDANGDGIYNPPDGDYPDIVGDMFHWYVMNDLDSSLHQAQWETAPLGIEVRAAMFGFDVEGPLKNTFFLKWQITNVGGEDLDSVFVGVWADPDLGSFHDDAMGTDTSLSMVYCYNFYTADYWYGDRPPAVGMMLLQTPIVPAPGDTAFVSGEPVADYRNLPPYAMIPYLGHTANFNDPQTALAAYRYLRGLIGPTGEPYYDPNTGLPTRNPATGEGWVCPYRNDYRLLISTGPFHLHPGESQEVVAAVVLSRGASNGLSVAALKQDAAFVQTVWENQFAFLEPIATVEKVSGLADTEATGPFTLQFQIQPNSGWELSPDPPRFIYQVGETVDSVNLAPVGMDHWVTLLPAFPEVASTTELRYWLRLTAADGTTMTWPFHSPPNYAAFLIGPDTTAPVVSALPQFPDVHFLRSFSREIFVEVSEERHGYTPPEIQWQIGEGSVQSVPMTADTTWGDDPNPTITWTGQFAGEPEALGDTIRYWVMTRDSSRAGNVGQSEPKYFVARTTEAIGNWEQGDTRDWDMFNSWSFTNLNLDSLNVRWDRVLYVYLTAPADTLTYRRPLDLTRFHRAWLTFNVMVFTTARENRGWFEISTDSMTWTVLDTFAGEPYQPEFLSRSYSLQEYLQQPAVFIRFRLQRVSGALHLNLDDIFLPEPPPVLPRTYRLYQNYPNPFNPLTTIRYDLPEPARVRLVIYDLLGREVAVLVDREQEPGFKAATWNASHVASGIYFYRLTAGDRQLTRKLIVLR